MNKFSKFRQDVRGLYPFVAPYRWQLIGVVIMIIVTSVALGIAPMLEGQITTQFMQDVTTSTQTGHAISISYQKVIETITLMVGVYLCKTISQACSILWLTNAIQHAMRDLRNAVMEKIRKLPVRYFDTHHYGDLLSRITNDIDAISNALQQSVAQVISGVLSILMALFMMVRSDFVMAGIAFMIIPFTLLITQFVVRKSQKLFRAQQDTLGDLNGTITELYTGYNEILLYNKQEDSIRKFQATNEKLRKNACKAQFVSSAISPLNSFVTYITIGCVAVVGVHKVMRKELALGQLQAFVRYIWQINDPLSQVSSLSSQIQSAFAALGRVMEVLGEEEEIPEVAEEPVKDIKGNVSFSHVKFGYGEEMLMKDLNVEVKSGQMVAIVGPTGAGKTTLINLLLRFYDVCDGSIQIDGIDIRDMKRGALHRMFGMVLQDTWLFHGSIYDNIRYGRLDARKDEIIAAAKMANVHHFVRTLPDGYHSFINEEANNISQGEKQLLTIARAILKNPSILILDEATSSVDTRLERMLQDAMQKVMKGRTSFVIAHRLSTIRNADLILVIQNGDIIEQGTHTSLMAKKGFYEQLYNSQFQEEEDA